MLLDARCTDLPTNRDQSAISEARGQHSVVETWGRHFAPMAKHTNRRIERHLGPKTRQRRAVQCNQVPGMHGIGLVGVHIDACGRILQKHDPVGGVVEGDHTGQMQFCA